MQIGQLARHAGVSIDTVRYYERAGVMPPPQRRASGYRTYGPRDIDRLSFVRRAKELGFTLDETRQLLTLASSDADMSLVKAAASEKLRDIEQRIGDLARIRDGLRQLVETCPGHGDVDTCPILAKISGTAER